MAVAFLVVVVFMISLWLVVRVVFFFNCSFSFFIFYFVSMIFDLMS
jgi:hypothetical protein